MKNGVIRPLVICIFQKGNKILVAEGYDSIRDDYFYRPIGGGIEFGETSSEALVREVEEEMETDICDIEYLGTVENLFTFNGEIGHEIVQVYDAKFVDSALYEKTTLVGIEDNGETYNAMWKPVSEFQQGRFRLVPGDLLDLIRENSGTFKTEGKKI